MLLLQAVAETNQLANILTGLGALGTSALLGAFKRTDYALAKKPAFRKAQPVITLLGALAAPYVAQWASSGVDISGLGQAPAATLGTVVLAEFLAMLKRST
jgi:hypothetical protein